MLTQRYYLNLQEMNSREPLYSFSYTIMLPDGNVIKDGTLAHSRWHAIDKAVLKHADKQPDRSKYDAKRNMDIVVR